MSNGKTQRSRRNGTAAVVANQPPSRCPRSRAPRRTRSSKRAPSSSTNARSVQQQQQRDFEAQHGRADRIDAALLGELQHLQLRFAAIAARQQRQLSGQEPKVNKFVRSLGEIIVDVTVAVASEKALELFTPIDEREYVGYNGGSLGRKGYDESVLAQYQIIDEKRAATAQDDDADPDEPVCLHETVEPYEDEPTRGACADCGADFDLTGAETEAQRTE